jgi:hypothetical protein
MTCEMDPGRRPLVDEIDVDSEVPGFGSTIAVILACAAMSLAIFPAAIALDAAGVPAGWAFAAGTLAAIIAIGKLAAIAWGAGSSLWSWHRASVAAAYAD